MLTEVVKHLKSVVMKKGWKFLFACHDMSLSVSALS